MPLKGRAPTRVEKTWMNRMTAVGCIVCRLYHHVESPAEIHHLDGKTKPNAHMHTIPLCSRHHRISDTQTPKRWYSFHGDPADFKREYGDGMFLLSAADQIAEVVYDNLR